MISHLFSFGSRMLGSTVQIVVDCLVKKKSSLSSKQKALTERLEEIIILFIDMYYKHFEAGAWYDLQDHVRDLIRVHALNVLHIIKQEICNNGTDRGGIKDNSERCI